MPPKRKKQDDAPLTIGFTGSRTGMTPSQRSQVRGILLELTKGQPWHARHGDCVGADAEFHALARELGAYIIKHPPSDSRLQAHCDADQSEDPQPYAKRNKAIVDNSDLVIGTPPTQNNPGYGGTWQTIRFAQDADKLYGIIIPNGAIIQP